MGKPRYIDNPDYRRHETLLRQLHQLIATGQGDSEAADFIRDEMEARWWHLDPEERDRLEGLSGDLYQLHGGDYYPKNDASVGEFEDQLASAASSNDWPGVLELLRGRPASFPDAKVARTRGIAWHQLGQVETAIEFVRLSLQQDPTDGFGRYLLLEMLDESGRAAEALTVARTFTLTGKDDLWWLLKYVALLAHTDAELTADWLKVRRDLSSIQQSELEAAPTLSFSRWAALAIASGMAGDAEGAATAVAEAQALAPDADAGEFVAELRRTLGSPVRRYVPMTLADRFSSFQPRVLSGPGVRVAA